MASSLLVLLDDITTVLDDVATMTKVAARKTAGVLGDDLALNAQQVSGVNADRELPVVWAVAKGSLVNKSILVPAALAISAFAPWAIVPLLMVGGAYLCFEGAEKVLEWFGFHHGGHDDEGGRDEKRLVMGAIRTDLILSTEIMLIGLSNVDPELDFWLRLAVLAVIALAMTALVYGAVALLVKIDDIGLKMAKSSSARVRHTGMRVVRSMPAVFRVISIVGTVAMLWVGGHLVLANLGEVGWHAPVELLHAVEHALEPLGPVVVWVGDTFVSAVAGLAVGLVIVGIALVIGKAFGKNLSFSEGHRAPHGETD